MVRVGLCSEDVLVGMQECMVWAAECMHADRGRQAWQCSCLVIEGSDGK